MVASVIAWAAVRIVRTPAPVGHRSPAQGRDWATYRRAAITLRANPFLFLAMGAGVYLVVSATLHTLEAAPELAVGASILACLFQGTLIYVALRAVTEIDEVLGEAPFKLGFPAFLGRLLLLALPVLLLSMPGYAISWLNLGFYIASFGVIVGTVLAAGYLIIGAIVLWLVLLGLFGTVLPDTAAGGAGSFSAAIRRGRRTFGGLLGRMLLGPVTAFAVFEAVMLFLAGKASRTGIVPLTLALGFVHALGIVVVTVLVAAVLARAWAFGGGTTAPDGKAE